MGVSLIFFSIEICRLSFYSSTSCHSKATDRITQDEMLRLLEKALFSAHIGTNKQTQIYMYIDGKRAREKKERMMYAWRTGE